MVYSLNKITKSNNFLKLSDFLRAIQDPTEELNKGFGNCCIFVYQYDQHQFSLKEVIRQEEQ